MKIIVERAVKAETWGPKEVMRFAESCENGRA